MTRFAEKNALALACALFAGVTVARFLTTDVNAPVTLLYVVPIAILAVRFGLRAGLVAALAAEVAFAGWAQIEEADVQALDYLARAVSFFALGGVAGALAQQRSYAEHRSTQIFAISNDLLGEANLTGHFTRVNPAWTKLLGWSAEELTSRPYVELIHPDDLEPTIAAAGGLADGPSEVVNFENRYATRDGEWRWLLWSARSDRDRIYVVGKDITERKAAEAANERRLETSEAMARTDALTGLPNRRAWDEELRRELSRSERLGLPLSIALLDLDHFKRFNDEHGHQAGDELLREAGQVWRIALRISDFIARYGGEEFGLLLPACPPEDAFAIVERIRAATPGQQTCSAGAAAWGPSESGNDLVRRADEALYEAKRAGRDRTVVGDSRPRADDGTGPARRT